MSPVLQPHSSHHWPAKQLRCCKTRRKQLPTNLIYIPEPQSQRLAAEIPEIFLATLVFAINIFSFLLASADWRKLSMFIKNSMAVSY